MTMPTSLCPNRMQVHSVRQETPDVWTINLINHDFYQYHAGQYALVSIRNSDETLRAYTLSSTPGLSPFLSLTVRRLDDGQGSGWLTGEVKPGDYLWLSDAQGEFTCDARPAERYLMLAAGCGVTPVMSMTRWILHRQPESQVTVIFNVRDKQQVIFAQEWQQLLTAFPARLRLILMVENSDETDELLSGRLSEEKLKALIPDIITSAFTPVAAQGGFAGATVWAAIRFGVARGVFSNEAGLGSAPIAHAAAKTQNPIRQGLIAMLGTFIDTIIVCSVTGLTIVIMGGWLTAETGATLTASSFKAAIPGGNYIVAIALTIFAFTTILGWSFYGEKCVQYLFGVKAIKVFRVLWLIALPIGATQSLEFVWLLADTLNAMMAIPNLIALILLSPVVYRLTRDHIRDVNADSIDMANELYQKK